MDSHRVRALQAHQSEIRRRWEALLRDEPVTSALADPDILVRLFETTLGELFATLKAHRRSSPVSSSDAYARVRTGCACGRNPLVTYFLTGERALLEVQASLDAAEFPPSATALTELHCAIRRIARREVDTFCGLCRFRTHGGGTLSAPPSHPRRVHRENPHQSAMTPAKPAVGCHA
jgi:hypothetical protein